MEQEPMDGGPAGSAGDVLEVRCDRDRAATIERHQRRRLLVSCIAFLVIGIAWLGLIAMRADSEWALFTVVGGIIAGAFLLLGLHYGIQLERAQGQPIMRGSSSEDPLLILDAAGIRLDEGYGVLVRYPWQMVAIEAGRLHQSQEETLSVHIGGVQRVLAVTALSETSTQVLQSAARFREQPHAS